MKKGTPILQANEMSIGYNSKKGNNAIASNINLSLKSGTLTALIGANGIGKSTLLRTLTGIQNPLAGTVVLNNKEVMDYTPADLAQHLSIVLTESLPPNNLTVYELVALGRQPYTNWVGRLSPEDHLKIDRALQLTQIQHLSGKRHFEISDGQLQKVLIARALAQDTPLIVLDEPTTHLDLQHKVNVLRLLKKLAIEEGKCILYSTHDLELALQLSDELIVMTPDSILQNTPEKCIEAKVFDTFFKDEGIVFDSLKGSFILK
jgi:iron complex transport system ATP-binding protein